MEHVTVTVDIDAPYRGHVLVDLISPDGVTSTLATARRLDKNRYGFQNWTFMSVAHWGSSGVGSWKLKVKSTHDNEIVTLKSWRLKMFGETIDAKKAKVISYGNDKEDAEVKSTESKTTTPTAQTSSFTTTSGEETSGANKLPRPEQAAQLYLAIFVIGAIVIIIYYLFFLKSRRIIRRSRAEAYEFDIIDTDSEYDSSINQTAESISGEVNDDNLEDFNFDINEEELSPRESSSNNPFGNESLESFDNSPDHTSNLLGQNSIPNK